MSVFSCVAEASARRKVTVSSRSSTHRRAEARTAGLSRLRRLNCETGDEVLDRNVPIAAIRLRNGLAISRLSLLTFEPFYSARATIPDLAEELCIQAA